MMQRPWTLVSGFVILTALGSVACSSADEPENEATGGSSGSGGSSSGGSSSGGTASGGTSSGGTSSGGTASGGTASGGTASGGTSSGGTASGGTSGTGGDAPNSDPECKGIKSDATCTVEGKACPNLVCGLADSGRRECSCAASWTCSACNYDDSPFKDKPDPLVACPMEAADEIPCAAEGTVCGPVGTEVCACYNDAKDGLIWDCDKPPSTWGGL